MNRFNLWIFLLLVISSIILGFVLYQVTGNIRNLIRQDAAIDRTNQRLVKLSEVVADLHEAQAVVRGYLITNDPQFQAKYQAISYTIGLDIDGLQSAFADDAAQHAQAGQLMEMLRGYMSDTKDMLQRYQAHTKASSQLRSAIVSEDGTALMALIAQMKNKEQTQLTDYRQLSSAGLTTTIVVSAVGLGGCIAIFLFLFWLIDREGVRRGLHEQSLKQMVSQMELIQLEMQQLGSLSEYLQSCREIDEIYALLGKHLAMMFPEFHGMLGVYNNSRNVIEEVARWGDTGPAGTSKEMNSFMPEDCWALRRGTVHAVGKNLNNPRCGHADHETGEMVCFPMVAHGETIGVLNIAIPQGQIDPRTQQIIRGISEHASMAIANMRLEKTLRMQSLRDPLTLLYNRRYMETSLEREIFRAKRRGDPVSLIMIDVDHFKHFNDSFGHEAGDLVLREFAKLLQQMIRGEDIACRYGGEEFILIMPGAAAVVALARAEKLRSLVPQMQLTHQGVPLGKISISLGVVTFPDHCDNLAELVKTADEALFRAKRGGRDRVESAAAA